jgi:branched-chain amino acid transport system permease protein
VLALWLGFERTHFGARIRAAVDNRRMAASLGVDVGRLFTVTFAIGSGLAAAGGGLGAEILGLDPELPVAVPRVLPHRRRSRRAGPRDRGLLRRAADRRARLRAEDLLPKGGTIFIYALTLVLLLWRPQGLFGRKAS